MAINISTLFADIIDTPEQRQQKLLQQGMMQGQLLSSGLQGRARAAAPLAQMAGQLGVQRNEDLRRAVQPMLGLDPRTTGEKMADQLKNLDPEDPNSLLQAAQALQSTDPVRAAALRQAAAEVRREATKREEQKKLFDLQVAGETQRQEMVDKSYALEEGKFLQGMQDSALQRQNILLTQERLQGNIADEKAARELRDKLQSERTDLQDTIAATYETSNPELSAFVKSGLMSDDALSKLIVKKPTEWVYETEQALMNGKVTNMRVAIDASNPNNRVRMFPSEDQPTPVKAPDIPTLTATYADAYAETIANNPTLSAMLEGESQFWGEDTNAQLTQAELSDIMHNMRFGQGLLLPEVNTIITELARNDPDSLARGIIPLEYINAASTNRGAGGNPPLVGGQDTGSAMNPPPVSSDLAAKYPGLRIVTPPTGTQPMPQQAALPNPFNVSADMLQPPAQQEPFQTAPTAQRGVGWDQAFEAKIEFEQQRVREGVTSPQRLAVVQNNYVKVLERNKSQLEDEIRYLGGLKNYKSFNKEERIAKAKAELKKIENRIERYKPKTNS
jgi:hypothetical protein